MRMMEFVAMEFIKGIGVAVMLNNGKIDGDITVLYYNWLGVDERLYSLLVPCTAASVYSADNIFATSSSINDALNKNLKVFDTREDWDDGKWTQQHAEKCSKEMSAFARCFVTTNCSIGDYTLVQSQLLVHPCIGMTLWYTYRGEYNTLTVWLRAKVEVEAKDERFEEFVEKLGISDLVTVVWPIGSLRALEAFDCEY